MWRPSSLSDIVGQEQIVKNLTVLAKSANERNDALPHCLFAGQTGLGKTTLATALANEVGTKITFANGANLRSVPNIISYVINVKFRDILFVDEIHRMTSIVEDFLLPVVEDFRIDMIDPKSKKTISIDLPKFTLIGATTNPGDLCAPLRKRFGFAVTLSRYNHDDMLKLVSISAQKQNVPLTDQEINGITRVSRGVPRHANKLIDWVRDVRISHPNRSMTEILEMVGISPDGITTDDYKYLTVLKSHFKGGPVGIKTLSRCVGIDQRTIEQEIEPFLLSRGMITLTTKGRKINANNEKI